MNDGGLAGRVAVRALLAQSSDTETGDGSGDEHTTRVRGCGVLLQHWRELADGIEDSLDIEIHDLRKRSVGVCVKTLSPRSASVCEKDVDLVSILLDLCDQTLNPSIGGRIGGHRDGYRAGLEVRKGVESLDRLLASCCLAGGDEDL